MKNSGFGSVKSHRDQDSPFGSMVFEGSKSETNSHTHGHHKLQMGKYVGGFDGSGIKNKNNLGVNSIKKKFIKQNTEGSDQNNSSLMQNKNLSGGGDSFQGKLSD